MQSIGEIIRDEQLNSNRQLRAIADDYEAAFMDASSTLSEVKPAINAFDSRVISYEESQKEIEISRNHQKRVVGSTVLVAHPETNVRFVNRPT